MKKIIYVADDGKQFDNEENCKAHDEKVAEENVKQKQLKEEKDSRYKEIVGIYDNLVEKIENYYKDYGTFSLKTRGRNIWVDSITPRFFFDRFFNFFE